ncbi:unnamed protein product, partial [Scytosiphon promiscuus]
MRSAIAVKVRLIDEGCTTTTTASAAAAAGSLDRTEEGPGQDGRGASGGGGAGVQDFMFSASEEENVGGELDGAGLPPVVIRETVSVDVKVPTVPITITTTALTELAWILGGFVVSEGDDEAGIDTAEAATSVPTVAPQEKSGARNSRNGGVDEKASARAGGGVGIEGGGKKKGGRKLGRGGSGPSP